MRDDLLQTLQATVTKTIFVKGSFAIFATKEGFSAKGDIIDDTQQLVGKKLTLHGRMVESRYGKTFQFFSYDYEQSRTELFYFLTSVIEGISDKLAEKITQHYPDGAAFDEVVQNNPDKLLQIQGLGKKRLEKIVRGWQQKQQLRSLWEFLSEYGVTNKMVLDIYENLGEQSINVIRQNPYAIADIKGVGFKKADALAMQLGFDPGAKKRLQSCILYTLQR
ncbi:MAG: helix-hairpin-helix domain-containing protein, partial [Campylobacterota bacterium]